MRRGGVQFHVLADRKGGLGGCRPALVALAT